MWSCCWYQKQTGTCAVSLLNGRTTGNMHTVWWWVFWTCIVITLKLQHCWKHNVIIVKASWKVNSSSVLHEASAKLDNSFEAGCSLLVIFCSKWSVEHSPMFIHYVLEHPVYRECLRSALRDEYLDLRGRKWWGNGGNSYNEKCHGLYCSPSV